MTTAGSPLACKKEGCGVASTGECAEGKTPAESCPNIVLAREDYVDAGPAAGSSSETKADLENISICSSDPLDQSGLNQLLRESLPSIVALLGEKDSGKTTLLASIYGQFCKGPIGNFSFKGSRTLTGFAKQYFLALLSSGLPAPKVPRTSRESSVRYYHLAVAHAEEASQVVISDRSGEAYEAARKDTSLISELAELSLANRYAFLVDSERLTSLESRATYAREFRQLLVALHDNQALDSTKPIELLVTKLDHLLSLNDETLVKYVDDYVASLVKEFSAKGFEVSSYKICALPKKKRDLGVIGLHELLDRWVAIPPEKKAAPITTNESVRELDRLVGRWTPNG